MSARKLFLIIQLLICSSLLTAQPAKLEGMFTTYPGKQPLPGVNVIARGAGAKVSKADGSFRFTFDSKKPGDKVLLTPVKGNFKPSRSDLPITVYLPANPDEVIVIEMCETGRCPEDELYAKLKANFDAQVQSIRNEIGQLPANSEKVQILQDSVQHLLYQMDQQEALYRELSKQIVHTDFERALPSTKAAIRHLESGQVDSAIIVLEEANLRKGLQDIQAEEEKLEQQQQALKEQKREHLEALMTLARSYALNRQHDSAEHTYELVISADSSNYQNRYDYAIYLSDRNRYEKALKQCESLLEAELEDWQIANLYSYIGEIHQETGHFSEAFQAYEQFVQAYQKFCREDSSSVFYRQNLAISYSKLGEIYQAQGNFVEALKYYSDYNQLTEELYESNPLSSGLFEGLGISYYKLGSISESLMQQDSSLLYYRKAGDIFSELYEKTLLPKYERFSQITEQNIENLLPPAEKVARSRDRIAQLENQRGTDDQQTFLRLAGEYGSLSWYLLFDRKFREAEKAAKQGISLGEKHQLEAETKWIYTNLATALLFQGKYQDAEQLYHRFMGKAYDDSRSWNEVFLTDLEELEAAGITHRDVAKVRKLLNESE